MADLEERTTDDLRLAEAAFRVRPGAAAIAGVVDAAVALLMAGADTPNLRILAGEDNAGRDEVEHFLGATLRDLRMAPLDYRAAALVLARNLALRSLGDEEAARSAAPALWRLFASRPDLSWPGAFLHLAIAADAVEDLPDLSTTMPEFLAAARDFLSSVH